MRCSREIVAWTKAATRRKISLDFGFGAADGGEKACYASGPLTPTESPIPSQFSARTSTLQYDVDLPPPVDAVEATKDPTRRLSVGQVGCTEAQHQAIHWSTVALDAVREDLAKFRCSRSHVVGVHVVYTIIWL